MNISPVNFISNIAKSPRGSARQNLQPRDVFIRTSNNISFKGDEKSSSFMEQAEKTDFLRTQLPEILSNQENKIGSGFSHSAYKIPEYSDYILRTSNSNDASELDFSQAVLKDKEDRNLKINIGQKIAEIEIPGKYGFPHTIEVLRKQTGESIGVPPSQAIFIEDTGRLREGEATYESRERKEYYASTIHQVAQLPQAAFEKLIDEMTTAAEAGYSFDHLNSNNLLVDSDKKSINIIDMEKSKMKMRHGNILYALTNIYYFPTFINKYDGCQMKDEQIEQAFGDTIQIIEKYTSAMKAKGIKFNREECSMEFFNLINSMPFSFFCKTGDYNTKWAALEKMGLA